LDARINWLPKYTLRPYIFSAAVTGDTPRLDENTQNSCWEGDIASKLRVSGTAWLESRILETRSMYRYFQRQIVASPPEPHAAAAPLKICLGCWCRTRGNQSCHPGPPTAHARVQSSVGLSLRLRLPSFTHTTPPCSPNIAALFPPDTALPGLPGTLTTTITHLRCEAESGYLALQRHRRLARHRRRTSLS